MRKIIALFGALALLCLAVPITLAQAEPASSPSLLADIWSVVSPLVVMAVSTIGPVLIGWLAWKLASLLNIQDAAKRQEIEARLRDALHKAAEAGAKVAAVRLGLPTTGNLSASSPVVQAAVEYVTTHNPETLEAFGLGDGDDTLAEIVLSKFHDLIAKR